MKDGRILLGVIGRPHGVRGLVHVQSYTADPRDLAGYGPLYDDRGGQWSLAWRSEGVAELRDAQGRPLPDRTAAEKLTNTRLYIDRDRLPEPDEEEFYLSDLVGLQAVDPGGTSIGTVATVHDYGAGASVEITRAGQPLIVPFTRACVPTIDIAGGRVIIVAPDEIIVPPLEATAGAEAHP
jgi:16S rRNA processing protein RimM